MINVFKEKIASLLNNKHFKYGGPFFTFILVGVVYLRATQSVRYEFKKTSTLTKEELEMVGGKSYKTALTLEEEYEKIKDLEFDDWSNKRGPRMWDETPTN